VAVTRVSAEEARKMVDEEGYSYVDVRSIPEFEAGHPEGAYNVPLLHARGGAMMPNPDFLSVMQRRFPTDAKLVIGCQSGARSLQAAMLLQSAGYTDVVDQRSGFEGSRDPYGRIEPGWRPQGLPVSRTAAAGRAYRELERAEP
jgi:rhodanese-related sulfurtransferase